jgi:peptidyl-prolyl cis-trans isomerase B (cyclophilin B)
MHRFPPHSFVLRDLISTPAQKMFNLRNIFTLAIVLFAGIWAVTAEGKGPLITHKVYFDIKQGDKNLGRSTSSALLHTTKPCTHVFRT